mmetsp:Transcript_29780/g.63167  ORF Transcript_29780/g.63167 Transcript_29780/m.63167 type:complete len:200 (-) Transcript_29780:1170-1769(-)
MHRLCNILIRGQPRTGELKMNTHKMVSICHTIPGATTLFQDNSALGLTPFKETANLTPSMELERAQLPISAFPNTHHIKLRNHKNGLHKLRYFFRRHHPMSQWMGLINSILRHTSTRRSKELSSLMLLAKLRCSLTRLGYLSSLSSALLGKSQMFAKPIQRCVPGQGIHLNIRIHSHLVYLQLLTEQHIMSKSVLMVGE